MRVTETQNGVYRDGIPKFQESENCTPLDSRRWKPEHREPEKVLGMMLWTDRLVRHNILHCARRERCHALQHSTRLTLPKRNKVQMPMIFHIADLFSLKLDQTLEYSVLRSRTVLNRSATSHTNALISFRTFSSPSSANLPFSVSPTFKTLGTALPHQSNFIKRRQPYQERRQRGEKTDSVVQVFKSRAADRLTVAGLHAREEASRKGGHVKRTFAYGLQYRSLGRNTVLYDTSTLSR